MWIFKKKLYRIYLSLPPEISLVMCSDLRSAYKSYPRNCIATLAHSILFHFIEIMCARADGTSSYNLQQLLLLQLKFIREGTI